MTAATLAVLSSLARYPGEWHYGYELLTESGLKSGSLYPILIRLADRGLLEARWEDPVSPGRPPRHLYRLTAAGRQLIGEVVVPTGRRQLQLRGA
ncbi:MAG: PadR family transcriptional regulator [Micrococcales bacterium]|nr:PadR family transcriptional regulator [Micrococcales bacterium]